MPSHLKSVQAPQKETAAQRGKKRIARLAELRRERSILHLRMANLDKEEAEILTEIAAEGATLETGRPRRKSPRTKIETRTLPDELTRASIEEVERLIG